MNLSQFLTASDIGNVTELEKVVLLSFYHLKKENIESFKIREACEWISSMGLGNPNTSRLEKNIRLSRKFIKAKEKDKYRLKQTEVVLLDLKFPSLSAKSNDIVCNDIILPNELFNETRGYIESVCKQINACYEYNIYDGCAVLMRRLIEILLIMTYENEGFGNEIKNLSNNTYVDLKDIIEKAINTNHINFSRNTRKHLEIFRKLGNFSAHRIEYNCKKKYIEEEIPDYRATVEELLHKSGIKN